MSDTDKAQRDFHLQAMKEAIERMKPELMAASEAAHRSKEKEDKGPGPEEFDRTMELGYLVDYLSQLCAPHLMLLDHIAEVLAACGRRRWRTRSQACSSTLSIGFALTPSNASGESRQALQKVIGMPRSTDYLAKRGAPQDVPPGDRAARRLEGIPLAPT